MGKLPFAIQLYTVRDYMDKDAPETLKRVKAAGYDYVELAGLAGRTAPEFKKLVTDAGLTAISAHVSVEELWKDTAPTVAMLNEFGIKYAAISWNAKDKAGWLANAKVLDSIGGKLHAAGVQFCYHNHAHEFEKFDGVYALDLLYQNTKPENLAAQIDVYWVKYGNEDPVAYIKKYAGRCPLLHIKDMAKGESRTFSEVGCGIIDMPAVIAAGKAAGTKWFIVEQDTCPVDSLESARISAEYMAKL
ncbi:MAG: sugar phosphate isomerase/epimerase [Candidatus Hydrogenedentes bacterium]|nr:sugar phosphate isomerase/epimerase [Candidatus Hydrogenedentota bacterium]